MTVSIYIGRTTQRLHIRRNPHLTNALRNWMENETSKHIKSISAIGQHLLNKIDCSKNYNDNRFLIVTIGRNSYHLCVLESLFTKIVKPNFCKQQIVYKSNLYKLL